MVRTRRNHNSPPFPCAFPKPAVGGRGCGLVSNRIIACPHPASYLTRKLATLNNQWRLKMMEHELRDAEARLAKRLKPEVGRAGGEAWHNHQPYAHTPLHS